VRTEPALAARPPLSTYRLQLHAGFGFASARAVAGYLSSLGITDCYCSPPFAARPGSTHGYDVINHNQINPELGGRAEFDRLVAELARLDLGLMVDFVPNHMGNDARTNEWWRDVLENGPSSPFARVFDIDWDPLKPELKNRLLLPILGEPYGTALEGGRLRLEFERGALVLCYGEHQLPINPRRGPLVFELGLDRLVAALGANDRRVREFLSIVTALKNLPAYTVRDEASIAERQREKEVARERLARLVAEAEPIRRHIALALAACNGTVGDPHSFDRLHDLLEQQAYRLAYWKTAADEINYRRFFDINELAGLRVEDDQVFDHIHELLLRLVAEGRITGLRLDHVDGLADPEAYLDRLHEAIRRARGGDPSSGEPRTPFYVVVEKILSAGETLPGGWATAGTTGYNFLNDVNGLFVERRAQRRVLRACVRLTGVNETLDDVEYETRRVIILNALSSEFHVLASAANRVSEGHRGSRDFTYESIRRALREVIACFPVYRTYVTARGVSRSDRRHVAAAVEAAQARNPAVEPSIFAFLKGVLLPERSPGHAPDGRSDPAYEARLNVALKCQQYTAPVQAKGVEDTAFYRYNALLSLNEVGGDPRRFGRSVEEFHAANRWRQTHWPLEMNATATHDTKRGEDARARLNVLSEIPGTWRDAVITWMRLNRASRTTAAQQLAPSRNDEYHFYQALVAVWPAELADVPVPAVAPDDLAGRLGQYLVKAIREAKVHTSWINPNAAYEAGVERFVAAILSGAGAPAFLPAFVPFARRVARVGAVNSLAQLVLKLVSPGVPDFYQGTELWDLTLVDPDNRRAVDFERRRAWLAEMDPLLERLAADPAAAGVEHLDPWLSNWTDGRIKLFVTAAGLRLRRRESTLLREGAYVPLVVEGTHREHVVACAREAAGTTIIAVVPRLVARLTDSSHGLVIPAESWADTRIQLPDGWRGRWQDVFTGRICTPDPGRDAIPVSRLLWPCPVTLLRAVGE
jgi:(1->4)-alpha-D-glucan 1-alpha-D-glucosylmutase